MMIIIMVILCCYDDIIQSKIARFLRLLLSLLNYHHYHYIIPQAHLAHYKHRVTMMMMIQTSIAIMTIMIMNGCLDPAVFINFGDILVQLEFFAEDFFLTNTT